MKLVILSGNSLRNQKYAHSLKNELNSIFSSAYLQEYKHWGSSDEWIDLLSELEELQKQNLGEDCFVIAKSIGTVLTVQAIVAGIIKPRGLLLIGIPLDYIQKEYPEFAKNLALSNTPTTVIQNIQDPVGDAKTTESYLKNIAEINKSKDFKFITSNGNTHDYEDYQLLKKEIQKLKSRL